MTGCRKEKIYYYSKDIYWVQATPSREPGTGYSVVDQKETRYMCLCNSQSEGGRQN